MHLQFTGWRTLPAKADLRATSQTAKSHVGQTIVGLGDLSDMDCRQLVACAGRGSSLVFAVEHLFADDFTEVGGDSDWIVESTEVPFEWWDVVGENGEVIFQCWLYHADCALVFEGGTTTVIAQGIQCGSAWEREAATPINLQDLTVAYHAAVAAYPKSDLAQHYPFEMD